MVLTGMIHYQKQMLLTPRLIPDTYSQSSLRHTGCLIQSNFGKLIRTAFFKIISVIQQENHSIEIVDTDAICNRALLILEKFAP